MFINKKGNLPEVKDTFKSKAHSQNIDLSISNPELDFQIIGLPNFSNLNDVINFFEDIALVHVYLLINFLNVLF